MKYSWKIVLLNHKSQHIMKQFNKKSFSVIIFIFIKTVLYQNVFAQDKILMFIAHEDTYYSEYVVMHQALTDAGYQVDVRSASAMDASTYMIPANTTVDATANTLPGGSYVQFQAQYQNYFGASWNAALNPTPATIPVMGSILDVLDMSTYVALVVAGGTGAQAYNIDGIYSSQGAGARLLSAATVQNIAEKLNSLAVEAIIAGKPVLGQCHGAGIPANWRYPVPNNTPREQLGSSILAGSQATGFPEPATADSLSNLGITYLANSPVVVASPHVSVPDLEAGNHKIITTRDWYPQTVAHAALTLINILKTFPSLTSSPIDVLILHGGAIDPNNCHFTNRNNDIPCNYGNGANDLPADYTHIQSLLQANSANDDFNFNVIQINITGAGLPFDLLNEGTMATYFSQFEVIIFYKHWSTGVTPALQNAIVSFADNGGGVVSLHHGLYNDIDGPTGYNKDILVNQLFNAQSSQSGWGANRLNYNLINTNLGHFITTNGLPYSNINQAPGSWFNHIPQAVNSGYSYYFGNTIFDEIYTNTSFVGSPVIGRNVNQITPLFGIGQLTGLQNFTSGFVKRFNQNNDDITGKVVYLQPGETRANYAVSHYFGQTIRNAIYWAGYKSCASGAVYRTTGNGVFTDLSNWEVLHGDGSASPALSLPASGHSIQIAHELTLNTNFTVSNCPLTLLNNGVSALNISPLVTLGFGGGTDGNAYFNNRPVTILSNVNGSGAIGEMTALSQTIDDGNVTVERYFHNHGNRRWSLLTIPVTNSTVHPTATIRDAWGGGSRPRVSGSNNRLGSPVYAYGPAPGKPLNVPFFSSRLPGNPLNVTDASDPAYNPAIFLPGDGNIITGHAYLNAAAANAAGFDWWDELVIPNGALYYVTPTTTAIATRTLRSSASIRSYRPDLFPPPLNPWESGSYINNGFNGGSIVNVPISNAEQGNFLFTRGDRNILENGSGITTLRPTGQIKKFNRDIPVAAFHTRPLTVVGNPYPAPISIDKVLNIAGNKNVINLKILVWDNKLGGPTSTGAFRTGTAIDNGNGTYNWFYTPAVGLGTDPQIISSGQAFMVEGTPTGGTLQLNESVKVLASVSNDLIQPMEVNGSVFSGMNIDLNRVEKDSTITSIDGAGILLNDSYTVDVNDANDVLKYSNIEPGLELSIQRDKTNLAIEAYPTPVKQEVFRLFTPKMRDQHYRFSFLIHNLGMDKMNVSLHDRALGKMIPVNGSAAVKYDFSGVGTDTMRSEHRFEIVMIPAVILPIKFVKISATSHAHYNMVKWKSSDDDEVKNYRVEHSTNGINFEKVDIVDQNASLNGNYEFKHEKVATGNHYYRVFALNHNGSGIYSSIAKINTSAAAEIQVYHNVLKGNEVINVKLNSMQAGRYTCSLTDAVGRTVKVTTIEHNDAFSLVYPFRLDNVSGKGIFYLTIKSDESSVVKKLIIQ
jgi:putative intracellular protease/amidase